MNSITPLFPLNRLLWKEAEPHYNNPSRTYHNVNYIEHGYQRLKEMRVKTTMAQEMAWIAHAVEQDPTVSDNLARSAAWIETVFKKAKVKLDAGERALIREAQDIIGSLNDYEPKVPSAAPIIDITIHRLGLDWDDYTQYTEALKEESPHMDEESWMARSQSFARLMLAREFIFQTPEGRRRWERRAQDNLSESLTCHPLQQKRMFSFKP